MGARVGEAILKFNKTSLELEAQFAILSSFSTFLQPPSCTSALLFNCLTYDSYEFITEDKPDVSLNLISHVQGW